MRGICRLALVLCAVFLIHFAQPTKADATGYWGSTQSDGCGNQCATPQAVCDYWGVFYGGGCRGFMYDVYDAYGQPTGLHYAVWYTLGNEMLGTTAFTFCPSGYTKDIGFPSGCSQYTPPVMRQVGGGCGQGNQGNNGNQANVGDPVNVINGNLFEEVTDYASAGPQKLAFTRYYNSLTRDLSMLGVGWRSNFDKKIKTLASDSVNVVRCDGAEFNFILSSGVWTTSKDVDGKLTTDGTTWTFTSANDSVETYDYASGLLLSVTTGDGYQQNLTYNSSGQLATVADSYGRTLTFGYANGVLQTLIDPDGRTYTYSYDAVVLTNPDRLLSVTYPGTSTPQVQYVYENAAYPHALTGIIDENGNRFATWTYDANSRVASAGHAGGAEQDTFSYSFNISGWGPVTVTNALGKQTIYTIGWVGGPNVNKVTQVAQAASANTQAATSTIQYDANGYVSQVVDYNGNTTNYTNNAKGQVTSKTEAAGTSVARTTTYTWDAPFHVPAQIVEPGRITNFTYDTNGRLLTKTQTDTTTSSVPYSTSGRARSWSYTYTSTGELATVTGRSTISPPMATIPQAR